MKVRKTAKIRKRYNQVPHLTLDTTWESNKNTINITNKSQEVNPFPAGYHKAAMNRRQSMRNTRHKNTNDPQKMYRLGTVSKNILLEGLNRFHGANQVAWESLPPHLNELNYESHYLKKKTTTKKQTET